MRLKVTLLLNLLLLTGCGQSFSETPSSSPSANGNSPEAEVDDFVLTKIVDAFDFDQLNDLEYVFDNTKYDISFLSGHNIIARDYEIIDDHLYIKKHYLVNLAPGVYALKVHAPNGQSTLNFEVLDRHNRYRIINHSFETGDLFGWTAHTVFKGERNLLAFTNDAVIARGKTSPEPLTDHGEYLLGPPLNENKALYEEKIGRLTSSLFTLGGSGYLTFKMGAGRVADLAYLAIYRARDHHEIARYSASQYHDPFSPSRDGATTSYRADLSAYLGEELYAVINDYGGREDDYLTFDALETYHEVVPDETASYLALNQLPTFAQDYAPNQLPNGDFRQGMALWKTSDNLGWSNSSTFHVEAMILKSNAQGDAGRGLIRSSLFTIDGVGYASLKLAAGKGVRFDKDTYVSVRLYGSNREIYRLANQRHDGTNLVEYFLDLSDYIDQVAYLEIVDNATDSWDTIFVSEIQTYYEDLPDLTTVNHARNLAY
ncbi:MAG: hypothetical protein ACOX6L_12760 [Syntrophomonadaceae bacterium]|jgi:fructan beta-fructosidase